MGASASMTMALFKILAAASVGLAPVPIHFLMAGAFRFVSLFSGLYQPSLYSSHPSMMERVTAGIAQHIHRSRQGLMPEHGSIDLLHLLRREQYNCEMNTDNPPSHQHRSILLFIDAYHET